MGPANEICRKYFPFQKFVTKLVLSLNFQIIWFKSRADHFAINCTRPEEGMAIWKQYIGNQPQYNPTATAVTYQFFI